MGDTYTQYHFQREFTDIFSPLSILTQHVQMFTANTSKHIVTYNFWINFSQTFKTDLYRVLNNTSCYKVSKLITYFPIDMILQMSSKTNINDLKKKKKVSVKYTVSAIVGKFVVLHINMFGQKRCFAFFSSFFFFPK